jgi:hypothetical protein
MSLSNVSLLWILRYHTKIATKRRKNKTANPEKITKTRAIKSSLKMSLVNCVLVNSCTRNQAVNKIPISNRSFVKRGNTVGFTGDRYRFID